MAVTARTPWSQILNQFAEGLDAIPDQRSAEILVLKSSLDTPSPQRDETVERDFPEATIEAARAPAAQYAAAMAAASAATVEMDPETGEDLADWTTTLDIINGMAGYADEQRSRVKEQAKSYKETLQDLQKELRDVHQRLRLFEKQAAETQHQADARVQRIQAEADAQVQEIRLAAEAQIRSVRNEADGRVKIADEKTRAANLRAVTAEKWLQRIDNAAKSLLTGCHTGI
jgi:chromosome segregation ATPase